MASGTQVLDNGEAIGRGALDRLSSHACVKDVRGVIVDFVQIHMPGRVLPREQRVRLGRSDADHVEILDLPAGTLVFMSR